jgi:putative transcription factor
MECEVCGKEIYGKAYRAVIDGAKLFVCPACAQFATTVWKGSPKESAVIKKIQRSPVSRASPFKRNTTSRLPEGLDLVEDFGQRIRVGRVKLKLGHEDLSRKIGAKVSVLQKLETGKMVPDIALAKRLERFLRIKILRPPSKPSKIDGEFVEKLPALTLGDLFIIQKRGVEEERGR